MGTPEVDGLLRELAPQVLGVLVRRHGGFDVCEDAVQEALLGAARQWPQQGVPDNPEGWLITAASRRLIEQYRSEAARRQREDKVVALTLRHRTPFRPPTTRSRSSRCAVTRA